MTIAELRKLPPDLLEACIEAKVVLELCGLYLDETTPREFSARLFYAVEAMMDAIAKATEVNKAYERR